MTYFLMSTLTSLGAIPVHCTDELGVRHRQKYTLYRRIREISYGYVKEIFSLRRVNAGLTVSS